MRSVAGGGVEQMSNLQARWDKFELMMESHQLMVKEQVLLLAIVHPMAPVFIAVYSRDLHWKFSVGNRGKYRGCGNKMPDNPAGW